MLKIGIIGGSGLEDPQILQNITRQEVDTPYGKPSAPLTIGTIHNTAVVIISRHGLQHEFSPTEVNYRANVYALKAAGVTHILATTACGSLREEIERGHLVILDQFIDFTNTESIRLPIHLKMGLCMRPWLHPLMKTCVIIYIKLHNHWVMRYTPKEQ